LTTSHPSASAPATDVQSKLAALQAALAAHAGGQPDRDVAAKLSDAARALLATAVSLGTEVADAHDAQQAALQAAARDLADALAPAPSFPGVPAWDLGPVTVAVTVADAAALAARLAGAVPSPGTHLCLSIGTYPGFSVPASWKGVVIRSATVWQNAPVDAPLAAVVTGNVTVAGPGCTVAGLKLDNTTAVNANTGSIVLRGTGSRVSRCLIDSPKPLADAVDVSANDCVVDGNEIRNFSNIAVYVASGAQRAKVSWNYVHKASTVAGRPLSHAGIQLGGTPAKVGVENPGGSVVEFNRIDDWTGVNGIELKSDDNTVSLNTLVGSGAGQCSISIRHGSRTKLVANCVENGQILLCGRDSVAVGNKTFGTRNNPSMRVKAGTCSTEDFLATGGGSGKYPYSMGARVIRHDGVVEVGSKPNGTETLAALATSVEACAGPVTVGGVPSVFARTTTTTWTEPVPAVRALVAADVGPMATRAVTA
jgi:hypothetical protein